MKYEELPPCEIKLLPSSEQVLKWELKPLPNDLKYSFLGIDETFSMVISLELDSLQECKLLNVLSKHKGVIEGTWITQKDLVHWFVLIGFI